jgi:hydantoinase/carbamoylase family amidase
VTDLNAAASAERLLAQCDVLAGFSSLGHGICRTWLSPEHKACNEQVAQWMSAAGLTVRVDAAGSLIGHRPGAAGNAPVLLIGSHLDSIPDAGRYDGILGVLLGIEVCAALGDTPLPFAIDVIGFGEEEGVRFGTTLMTSRATAGTFEAEWLALQDADGTTVAQALDRFGLNAARIADAAYDGGQLLGYLEAHIEQGPVLEDLGLPLAVVTSIAGAKRLAFEIGGMAAHAGTMPMDRRQDALVGAAHCIAAIEQQAVAHGVLATVGTIEALPGGVNVVPGGARFTLDIRAGDDGRREAALDAIAAAAERCCADRGLTIDVQLLHQASAAPCDPTLQAAIARGIEATGQTPHYMESGAGHDAMALATLCPVGMLFLRCTGGISHHPDEAVLVDDVARTFTALHATVQALAAEHAR